MKASPLKILQSMDMFSQLDKQQLTSLFTSMITRDYSKGKTLFHEGDLGDTLYILLTGVIAITLKTPQGDTLELAQIKPGNFFGEMSIFDNSPRSATCSTLEDATLLCLRSEDFYRFIKENPKAGIAIMNPMLQTTTSRLQKTGAFLEDMVTWGEQARTRAITDDCTGLYNRRFLDESLEGRVRQAQQGKTPLTMVMIDLDHFGKLNLEFGQETGNQILLEVVSIFRNVFREDDILARYGGDEFCFLLPNTSTEKTLSLCNKMVRDIGRIKTLEGLQGSMNKITASAGIACLPTGSMSVELLIERADKALYQAKEAGRNRAQIWVQQHSTKTALTSIAQRNRIIQRIFDLIDRNNNFLIIGHKQPDEDCISSMISMGLLLRNFHKKVSLLIPRRLNRKYQYMINISRYNSLDILYNDEEIQEDFSVIFFMDTPKPDMREQFPRDRELLNSSIIKVEVDHHLQADSGYLGDEDFRLVDDAASASELVGILAIKLQKQNKLVKKYNIHDLFTRNFVLAVLTGIVGDTKMGQYLKTRKERMYYKLFSNLFNDLLVKKTRQNSKNFSSMKDIFKEMQKLSLGEDECYALMKEYNGISIKNINAVVIGKKEMAPINGLFDNETVVTVARYLADELAEACGVMGMVAYVDRGEENPLVQFRIRRSQDFNALDLRKIIEVLNSYKPLNILDFSKNIN
jgi:diguanylate cyclase (GGDEF)-like protein